MRRICFAFGSSLGNGDSPWNPTRESSSHTGLDRRPYSWPVPGHEGRPGRRIPMGVACLRSISSRPPFGYPMLLSTPIAYLPKAREEVEIDGQEAAVPSGGQIHFQSFPKSDFDDVLAMAWPISDQSMLSAAIISFARLADDGVVDELQGPIVIELELEDDPIAISAVAQLLQSRTVGAVWNGDMLTLPVAAFLLDDHCDGRSRDKRRQGPYFLREHAGGDCRKEQGEEGAHALAPSVLLPSSGRRRLRRPAAP